MRVSVSSGRWGPCCSSEPSGTASSAAPAGRLHLGPGGSGELHGAQVRAGERKRTGVGTGNGVPSRPTFEWPRTDRGRSSRAGERGLTVAVHAFGVRAVERQAGEELGRHAAAAAGVERAARGAGPGALGLAQRGEQCRLAPDGGEAPGLADVAGQELAVDDEGAGVHVADRVDEADHPSGAAQVQPVERLAQGGEVEEGVARQHAGPLDAASGRACAAAPPSGAAHPRCRRPRPEGRRRVSRSWAP